MGDPVAELRTAVEAAASSLRDGADAPGSEPTLERPPKAEFGDYSTNAAMLLAPVLGEQPRGTAEKLAEELGRSLEGTVEKVEVAGPGFLNLFLSADWYRRAAGELAAAGEDLGRPAASPQAKERVNVEFVSANPTGPITAAGGRGAALGDSIARILEFTGHSMTREYYVNDRGGQIDRFAASIAARMKGEPVPEEGYEGDYVVEIAKSLEQEGLSPNDLDDVGRRGVALMLAAAEETLRRYGVVFDTWSSERALHESDAVERALEQAKEGGHVYESEGATWLRTTTFGDDKDRVLIRSDGDPTYLLSDLAYHRDKLERGSDRLIDVLGADHHGYVERLRAALAVLGYDPDSLEVAIMQLVHVVEGGSARRCRRGAVTSSRSKRQRRSSPKPSTPQVSSHQASFRNMSATSIARCRIAVQVRMYSPAQSSSTVRCRATCSKSVFSQSILRSAMVTTASGRSPERFPTSSRNSGSACCRSICRPRPQKSCPASSSRSTSHSSARWASHLRR
jgi:arginyl-tRNA synthetase